MFNIVLQRHWLKCEKVIKRMYVKPHASQLAVFVWEEIQLHMWQLGFFRRFDRNQFQYLPLKEHFLKKKKKEQPEVKNRRKRKRRSGKRSNCQEDLAWKNKNKQKKRNHLIIVNHHAKCSYDCARRDIPQCSLLFLGVTSRSAGL